MANQSFLDQWGIGALPPAAPDSDTRTLDPQAFSQTWLTSPPEPPAQENTNTTTSTAAAGLGSGIDAIPIIGPWLKTGTQRAAAGVRSAMYGTPYADELKAVQNYATQSEAAHPVASGVGTVTGAVAPMLAGAGIAPELLGLTGPLWQRAAVGAASNGLINAADAASRGEGVGDITKSGATGVALGAGLPVAGKVLGATGNALLGSGSAATHALVAKANALGIPIYFSQTTSSPFVAKLAQMAGKLPGSGMSALNDVQQTAFNRAVAGTFGESADRITPDVMASAKKRIGSVFDMVADKTPVYADPDFTNALRGIAHDASGVLTDQEMKPLIRQISNIAEKSDPQTNTISGSAYQALTRKGSPLDVAMNSNNSNIAHYAGEIRNALDDALERSASPRMRNALQQARSQYKSMKTVEDLVAESPTGDISPVKLMSKVRNSYGNMAYGGGGDLGDISRVGQKFMRTPADSGTPLGHAAIDLLLGAGLAGVGAGGGYALSGDPMDALKGAALLPATAMVARGATTLLNRPQAVNALFQKTPLLAPAFNHLTAQQPQ